MIDSPRRKRIEKTSKSNGKEIVEGVDFRSLLFPGLIPGQKINIQSANIDNEFVIQEITYTGSSRGGSFEAQGFAI